MSRFLEFRSAETHPNTVFARGVLLLAWSVLLACGGKGGAHDGSGGHAGTTSLGGSSAGGESSGGVHSVAASGAAGAGHGGISGTGGGAATAGAAGASAGTAGAAQGVGGVAGAGGSGRGGSGGNSSASGAGGAGATAGAPLVAPGGSSYDGERPTTTSFDTDWKFHLGDVSGAQGSSFDDSTWTSLDVPHDYSISQPFMQNSPAGAGGGYLNGGTGWYRKTFTLPSSSSGQRLFVQFDGVYMNSTVYLNGTQVCGRPYGYSSFECDITADAKLGAPNVLAVKTNNQQPSSRWYSGSGIYRHVWLKTVSPVHVAYTGTAVTTPQVSSAGATINLALTVQNDATTDQMVTVASTVVDAGGANVVVAAPSTLSVAGGKSGSVTQTAAVMNPALWSPSAPNLYAVITTLSVGGAVVDTYKTPFGIRSFAFDANEGFSLNGVPVKLNGTCNHHDLGALGAAVNQRAIEKRLQQLKSMGVNALRTSHNPPAPELLDLADRLGFLVMDEAFDCWDQSKNAYDYARFFSQWSTIDIGDMVARDRNHPSVVIWSIGNEIQDSNNADVAASLISAVKAKDMTRVIGQAFAEASPGAAVAPLEDVIGLNYAPYTYDSLHSSNKSWKLFASESSSAVRSRGVYKTPVSSNILSSSDNQCSSYDNSVVSWGTSAEGSWSSVNSRSFIAGEFIWTGFDYIGEPTPYTWPSKSSYFGAIDTAGFPKDIFYFYQSKWNAGGPPMVHVAPTDWTSFTAGQAVPVFVYTNAESAELFLNGSSLGSKKMTSTTGHLEWSVPFATGTLEAKASKGGTVVATDAVKTAGAAAKLTLSPDRTSIMADGRDLSYVEVDIVDAQGVVVPKAGPTISITVDGPGTLVGLDAGDATNHDSYKGTSHAAFNGKLIAIVQATTTAGTVTVNATAPDLTSGFSTITTGAP